MYNIFLFYMIVFLQNFMEDKNVYINNICFHRNTFHIMMEYIIYFILRYFHLLMKLNLIVFKNKICDYIILNSVFVSCRFYHIK